MQASAVLSSRKAALQAGLPKQSDTAAAYGEIVLLQTMQLYRARAQGLGELPRRTAARFQDKLAIFDGKTRLTFANFDEYVDRVAANIDAAGIRHGDKYCCLRDIRQSSVLSFATRRVGVILVADELYARN